MKKFPIYRPFGSKRSPLKRNWSSRMETLACLIHSSSIILFPALFFLFLTQKWLWPPLLIYSIYSYFLDNTLSTGESLWRESQYLKSFSIYKSFINYFPIYIHRTVKLPPSIESGFENRYDYPVWTMGISKSAKSILESIGLISKSFRNIPTEKKIGPRYMFTYHPHGVIAFGITGVMCYNNENDRSSWVTGKLKSSQQFSTLFPNIKSHLLTLTTQFSLPFYRDYLMALGVGLVTKSGIKSILNLGHSVVIVVGGAHESLLAKPGKNAIVLNRRKGFIKMALQSSTVTEEMQQQVLTSDQINNLINQGGWESNLGDIAIVPVYGYGENNIHEVYTTTNHSKNNNNENDNKILKILLKFQLLLKKYSGFTLPLVNSRAVFNYDFGLLPYRRRMDVVYGKPIYIVRKFGNKPGDPITEEEIDYYHNLYKTQLLNLWKENKEFATEWDEQLKFVE